MAGNTRKVNTVLDIQVLAAQCEFFEAAFFGERVDRSKEVCELPDVDPDDFEVFQAVTFPTRMALNGKAL